MITLACIFKGLWTKLTQIIVYGLNQTLPNNWMSK